MINVKTLAIAATLAATGGTSAMAATLTGLVNIDNKFVAFLSTSDTVEGTGFAEGDRWTNAYSIGEDLVDGVTNYLHILAIDNGGPAGFLGSFSLSGTDFEFGNGTQNLLTGEGHFSVSESGWQDYVAVTDYGLNGVNPWRGRTSANSADARWIWSDDNQNDNQVYFTTAITQVAAVPVPASLPLLAGALGLMGFARRRATRG